LLHAFAPDGTEKWTFGDKSSGIASWSPPAIGADGTVYFGNDSGLHALAPDGTERWSFADTGNIGWMTEGAIMSMPVVGADGTIYFGIFGGAIYAVDADGHLRWKHDDRGSDTVGVQSSGAFATDGTLYWGTNAGHLYAFAP